MVPQTTRKLRRTLILFLAALAFSLAAFYGTDTSAQGQVQVTAADPPAAEQGTINLNVNIRHEILVKVDKQLDSAIDKNSDIF